MNKVEKIKVEIERLKNELIQEAEKGYKSDFDEGRISAFEDMIVYIDSLEEEPVSNDLEEACDEYYDKTWDEHGGKAMVVDGCHDIWFPSQATDDFFKAGAQWQKQQDQSTIELAEDHAMLAGMEKMKEEMIDKFFKWLAKHWREYVWLTDNNVIHFGHWEYDFKKAMEK